jgi:release factor glutamine methyltransferase
VASYDGGSEENRWNASGDADWTGSGSGKGKTIREVYANACAWLAGRGVQEPAANAERLLQELLGWSRTRLLLNWSEPFPEEEKGLQWQQWLGRKAMGEPVQYIVGEQSFYGLPFYVGPAVLIPRPETELLVERVLELGRQLWPEPGAAPVLGDIGTGSGCIPVTVAVNRPQWRVYGSDISAAALEMAKRNAARHGARVEWLEGDLLEPYIRGGIDLDILVSNPPYIPAGDVAGLQPEVRLYEPHLALVGGEDGLVLYRRLADELRRLPRPPQLVAFEVGQGQADEVLALLRGVRAWQESEIVLDLAGISRHVIVYDRSR